MLALIALACQGDPSAAGEPPRADTPTESGVRPPESGDTAGPTGSSATAATGSTAATGDTGATWDCATLSSSPTVTSLVGPPASEDFAFDDAGNLVSFDGVVLVATPFPPGASVPFATTPGKGSGPASLRYLPSTGHFVFHNVDTSTIYDVDPVSGSVVPFFTGFGYAAAIEVRPGDGLLYVVDILGLRTFDLAAGTNTQHYPQGAWSGPDGASLSVDGRTLYVSSRNGIWAVPLDADGWPNGPLSLWAPEPSSGDANLGMGVDACGNVYVAGSSSGGAAVWRYDAAGGSEPELLLEKAGGWLTNMQWGSGIGGWDPLTLYVVDRNGEYVAVEVGVPQKPR